MTFPFFKKAKREPKNLKEVLSCLKDLEKNISEIKKDLENLKLESQFFLKKVGIIRYNPFSDTGGNQSFSIALLDRNNSGIVITSLYTREGNRVYAKPIKEGKSHYSLSEEEKKAIERAKNSQIGNFKYDSKNKKSKGNNQTASGGGFRTH